MLLFFAAMFVMIEAAAGAWALWLACGCCAAWSGEHRSPLAPAAAPQACFASPLPTLRNTEIGMIEMCATLLPLLHTL